MTISDIFTYTRSLTKTTSSQFSDATLLSWIKIWLHKVQREIAMIRADYFATKDYTFGVLDQEDYPLPADCLEVKKVEICYNADKPESEQVWYKANEIDIGQRGESWDTIQKTATTNSPVYDLINHRLYIAPIRSSSIGDSASVKIRLWYIERPADPTTVSDTPLISALDDSLNDYQYLLADGLAYDILTALGSPRADSFMSRYLMDVEKMKKELKQQDIGQIRATVPFDDGSEY